MEPSRMGPEPCVFPRQEDARLTVSVETVRDRHYKLIRKFGYSHQSIFHP